MLDRPSGHQQIQEREVSECCAEALREVEEQYAFVGGTMLEYARYFHREDFPRDS